MINLQSIRRLTLPALMLAASAASGLAWAGPNNVPFKASVTTQEFIYPDPSCSDGSYLGRTTGKGKASHMGAISVVASDCAMPLDQLGMNWSFSGGILTITAANGDTLTASYSGILSLNPSTGLHSLSGTYEVTRGNGRFDSATGSGSLQGTLNLMSGQPAPGQLEMSGVLSYSKRQ